VNVRDGMQLDAAQRTAHLSYSAFPVNVRDCNWMQPSALMHSIVHCPLHMDGAFSSYRYDLKLFSTAALRETPEAVTQLHADYIDAGCDIITTAS
jgi:hypothetical protein